MVSFYRSGLGSLGGQLLFKAMDTLNARQGEYHLGNTLCKLRKIRWSKDLSMDYRFQPRQISCYFIKSLVESDQSNLTGLKSGATTVKFSLQILAPGFITSLAKRSKSL